MKDKDIKKIERLIELMEKSGLTEIEIKKPFFKIHLIKKEREAPSKHRIERLQEEGVTIEREVRKIEEIKKVEEVKKEPEEKEDKFYYVVAPLVGTFYRAPAPDAEPYVEVGSKVRPGQVLCIIEAMKIMNEIESDVEGIVREILVKNGEPVEYGQKLFKIELV
ncbi:MAG: acetyl-CoA carboxylase biotin carboxyl carrier protein [Candidatus Hydrothermales bacterium]